MSGIKPSLPDSSSNNKPSDVVEIGAIPSITLLGKNADWEKLGQRIKNAGQGDKDPGLVKYRKVSEEFVPNLC